MCVLNGNAWHLTVIIETPLSQDGIEPPAVATFSQALGMPAYQFPTHVRKRQSRPAHPSSDDAVKHKRRNPADHGEKTSTGTTGIVWCPLSAPVEPQRALSLDLGDAKSGESRVEASHDGKEH